MTVRDDESRSATDLSIGDRPPRPWSSRATIMLSRVNGALGTRRLFADDYTSSGQASWQTRDLNRDSTAGAYRTVWLRRR
jgi:hypothetical protein